MRKANNSEVNLVNVKGQVKHEVSEILDEMQRVLSVHLGMKNPPMGLVFNELVLNFGQKQIDLWLGQDSDPPPPEDDEATRTPRRWMDRARSTRSPAHHKGKPQALAS